MATGRMGQVGTQMGSSGAWPLPSLGLVGLGLQGRGVSETTEPPGADLVCPPPYISN